MMLTYGSFGTESRWLLFINNGKLQMGVDGGNIVSTQTLADGQWHHVAAVLEAPDSGPASVQDLRLYIDGLPEPGTYTNPDVEINTGTDMPVRIGANQISTDGTLGSFFGGQIDEVRMYDAALSAGQIAAMAGDVEALFTRTISNKRQQTVFAIFDRDEVIDAVQAADLKEIKNRGRWRNRNRGTSSETDIAVYSKLESGQVIGGTDTIRVILPLDIEEKPGHGQTRTRLPFATTRQARRIKNFELRRRLSIDY